MFSIFTKQNAPWRELALAACLSAHLVGCHSARGLPSRLVGGEPVPPIPVEPTMSAPAAAADQPGGCEVPCSPSHFAMEPIANNAGPMPQGSRPAAPGLLVPAPPEMLNDPFPEGAEPLANSAATAPPPAPAADETQAQLKEALDRSASLAHQDELQHARISALEAELKMSHEALQSLRTALDTSNREVARLDEDLTYWREEFRRLEREMKAQHQRDLESLDQLSAALGSLIEPDSKTPQGSP